ncbi:hypothetical protein Bhyg_07762 [Pseudolycoriella hygida]|uniref:Regulatory protein zeste n=1 Tax=Pseudolycoriella hygida TaxID=35572 RepID=A0A9Q0S3N8_9DIPT|nr:hypothetical protein Bhyg_07762 [Pseudolycoriella hygida]
MADMNDELFNQFIEYDEEKENQDDKSKKIKVLTPTQEQYDRISAFYRENTTEKRVMDILWSNLVEHLNKIGPPTFSEAEWRRKWTVHKYYEKKRLLKRLADPEARSAAHSLTSATGHSPQSSTSATVSAADMQSNILRQLMEISTKQNIILQSQNSMKSDIRSLKAHFEL